MSIKPVECEMWVAMTESGDWVVVKDESEALSDLAEYEGGCAARVVKVTVTMTPPVIAEATVAIPDDIGKTEVIAA